jgi:hypothetical protein
MKLRHFGKTIESGGTEIMTINFDKHMMNQDN